MYIIMYVHVNVCSAPVQGKITVLRCQNVVRILNSDSGLLLSVTFFFSYHIWCHL